MKRLLSLCICVMSFFVAVQLSFGSEEQAQEQENASNPLAAVNNVDVRAKYFDLGNNVERYDYFLDGAFMATPKLKIKYELHYWDTDVTGSSESDWESFHLKPIYFPTEGAWGRFQYRLAVGLEWILDFDNRDKGIGSGSDQLAPFAGIALMGENGLVLVPLIQHFVEYDGPDVNTTAFRLIGIQSLPNNFWIKLDGKLLVDWEHNNETPIDIEVQLGKMFTPSIGTFIDGLFGIGGDRSFDWGVGLGVRFNY